MNCDHCEQDRIYIDGFETCTECGMVFRDNMEYVNGITNVVEPMQVCVYQRKKRFEEMLKRLTCPTFDKKDTPILKEFLHKPKFETIDLFLEALKNTKIKDKRYQSLHAFCQIFVVDYNAPAVLQPHEINHILALFETVECRFHNKTNKIPFFNYNWLLGKLLERIGITRFHKYLKKIKCKKRNFYYETLYNDLFCDDPTLIQKADDKPEEMPSVCDIIPNFLYTKLAA